ncbi:hypothetical protein WJX77_003855 [Trebouxia sp. C0004]
MLCASPFAASKEVTRNSNEAQLSLSSRLMHMQQTLASKPQPGISAPSTPAGLNTTLKHITITDPTVAEEVVSGDILD